MATATPFFIAVVRAHQCTVLQPSQAIPGLVFVHHFPVPVSGTRSGLPKAPLLMVSEPERAPTAVGVKVTPTVHVSPAPTLEPQVLLATTKSPFATIAETVNAALR